jgi:hypothetical protein
MDPAALRNRLVIASSMWRESTTDPLPKIPPGDPAEQIQTFELQLVEMLFAQATAEDARRIADKTWDMVHDRPDDDPVKQRVTAGHEVLAKLSAEADPGLS